MAAATHGAVNNGTTANTIKELSPAPGDGVSRVVFNKSGSQVVYVSWGGVTAIHNGVTGLLQAEKEIPSKCAILDVCWAVDGTETIAVAALDGRVLSADAGLTNWSVVGRHDQTAARGIIHNSTHRLLISGGWDSTLRFWDLRSQNAASQNEVKLDGKCFGLARYGADAVVAITSSRRVVIVDVRKPTEFIHDKVPSALAYQLRGISANTEGSCYVVGSTEGKVALEWPDEPNAGYSFRCHRQDGLAFPVNCIAHCSRYGSFATGGGDGHVAVWDAKNKKRMVQYPREPTSIASIDFNPDCSSMAVAVSYTFEEMLKDSPPDRVYIRSIMEDEVSTT